MGLNDLTSNERRLDIVLYLSQMREVHYADLINRYNVSAPVIRRDLKYIEDILHIPIKSKRGRAGSIKVTNPEWSIYQKRLSKRQESAIKKALSLLPADDKDDIQSVLDDFAPQE